MTAHATHEKTRVAAISVFVSAGMAAAKFAVGIIIGSLALISEALHSSVDVIATIITWLVVRVSDRRPTTSTITATASSRASPRSG